MARKTCKIPLSASFAKADKQIPEADRPLVEKSLLEEYSCYPVYLPDDIAEQHYNGEHYSAGWRDKAHLQDSPTPSYGHYSTTTPER